MTNFIISIIFYMNKRRRKKWRKKQFVFSGVTTIESMFSYGNPITKKMVEDAVRLIAKHG